MNGLRVRILFWLLGYRISNLEVFAIEARKHIDALHKRLSKVEGSAPKRRLHVRNRR
jgi:hypothetical protein